LKSLKFKYLLITVLLSSLIIYSIIFLNILIKYFPSVNADGIRRILPFFLTGVGAFILASIISYLVSKKINNSFIKRIVIIGLSVIFITILSGKVGWPIQFSIGGCAFCIAGYLAGGKELNRNLIAFLTLSLPLFLIILFLLLKDNLYHMLPLMIVIPLSVFLGITIKYLMLNKKKIFIYLLSIFSISLYIFGYFGTLNWCEYTFSLNKNSSIKTLSINFKTLDNKIVDNNSLSGKISIFYYWTASCSICYKKMPDLEKLAVKYREDEDIQVYAIIVPLSLIDTTSNKILNKLSIKYSLNYAISLTNINEITSNLNFQTFPHVIVVGKSGEVVYNGRFNNDPHILVNNMTKMIDRYKKGTLLPVTH
jgi:thiol-disulfide isomerase/thioredoxin